jgi:hypothetical protein|tara:strand:+ start:30899 stop:32227 length:1329 start_codon:yes stop_codon:yes gene_type:complete
MFKKISLIFFLAILLAGFLFVRHFWSEKSESPLLVDRLPTADFLIRANILDVARETSGMLHYNKIPFRDFFSQEFLLGQAKSYGLNLQRPVYIFAQESGDWGALVHVTDSSKIQAGLTRIDKIKPFRDTIIYKQKVAYWPKEKLYLNYGENYLFVYKGDNFEFKFFHVLQAQRGEIEASWKDFLSMNRFKKENLVLYANSKGLKKYGVEKAVFSHDSDSTSLTMLSYVKCQKPLNFSQKKNGLSLEENYFSSKFLNLHLNINEFRNHPEDPLYRLMTQMSKKISFPLKEFLAAWEGDLSFRQGGKQKVTETYIESELDENFEISEVVKTRELYVPGFSLAISLNGKGQSFMNKIINKGILTQEEEKYRFLGSPALNFYRLQNYYVFTSGENRPRLSNNEQNNGVWNQNGTKFQFHLDSLKGNEAFGKVHFPVNRLIERNKFF